MSEARYSRADLHRLLELQRTDSEILRLRSAVARKLEDLEVAGARARVAATAKAAQDLKERVLKLRRAVSWEEREADDRRAKVAEMEKRMYGGLVGDPKELDQMRKRVAQLRAEISQHEETGLEAMVELEEAEPAQAEALRAADEAARDLSAALERQEAGLGELRAEIARLEPCRAAAAGRLPGDLLSLYERIRDRRAGVGAGELRPDGLCGACLVKVPLSLARSVQEGQLEACESCGRLLVYVGAVE